MTSTTAEAVIKVLRKLFSTHSLPDILVSDNDPQFMATQFKLFLVEQGIHQALIAPFHPPVMGKQKEWCNQPKKHYPEWAKGTGKCESINSY